MKLFFIGCLTVSFTSLHALEINELFSNPVGDDSGREWVEICSQDIFPLDIAKVSLSIKGGKPVLVTPVSGEGILTQEGCFIVGSTLSGQTKFSEDYPAISVPVGKASISLVNTGSTSIALYYDGLLKDEILSYTPAKEGKSLERSGLGWVEGVPTPGEKSSKVPQTEPTPSLPSLNQIKNKEEDGSTESQDVVIEQSPELVIKTQKERLVIAGAPTEYSARVGLSKGSLTRPVSVYWSFGDGGERSGASTTYAYVYTGTYIATVTAESDALETITKVKVKVVPPNISILGIKEDQHGVYVELSNPNQYDLAVSQWRLMIDGAQYILPRNTILLASSTTRLSGVAMGFSKVSISSSTVVKLVFPHNEEVARYEKKSEVINLLKQVPTLGVKTFLNTTPKAQAKSVTHPQKIEKVESTSTVVFIQPKEEKRLAFFSWLSGLFGK